MANTSRRYIDQNGKMFIPMNVEGSSWEDNFITTPKLVVIGLMLGSAVFMGFYLKENYSPLGSYIIFYALWFLICSLITRFYIFEEKYYYRMYKQLKESEISTPAVFWDIASIKDTRDGAILTYSDAKIGVLVRLDRDTITGKPPEFQEAHYDAISDFYKEIMQNKYNFVQMNIMEQAGNDPRLDELDKLVYGSDNPNIRQLMELQIGYIKNITHHTLYESDYILFYTNDLSKVDCIISDVIDMIYKILDGAYIGYRVLSARDIIEFMKEEYGVKYFNYAEATLTMFKKHGVNTRNPFELTKINYTDGDVQEVKSRDIIKINKMASDVLNGTLNISTISIKEALYPKEKQNNKKVDFDSLSKGFSEPSRQQQHGHGQIGRRQKGVKPLPNLNKSKETSQVDKTPENIRNNSYTEDLNSSNTVSLDKNSILFDDDDDSIQGY